MTTQEIAATFAVNANNSINQQLGNELKRLGLLAVIESKTGKLVKTTAKSKEDARFINETFSVEFSHLGKPIKRMVMNVNWTPSGFNIERYNDEMANAIKTSPDFKISKGQEPDFKAMSQFDIEVEALAAKKMAQYLRDKKNVQSN